MSRLTATLAALVAALACLVLPAEALAARGVVTLDLRPQAGPVPTHLCVVSEARGPRTRQLLWELLESKPTEGNGAGRAWRVKPDAWGGAQAEQDSQRCGADPIADCGPRVELPSGLKRDADLFVACTADSLVSESGATTDPRILVVLLEQLGGSPPMIESVRLAGGIATVGVQASLDRVEVTSSSLGGSYLPHRRSYRGEGTGSSKLVVLDIAPRCKWVEVALPRAQLAPADRDRLTVRAHGVELDVNRCVDDLGTGEVIRVRVPQAPNLRGRLDVEIGAAGGGGPPEARFGARWTGRWPGSPFELKLNLLTFRWQRPECIYPTDRCPRATLETGTICSSTVTQNGCEYRCPGDASEEEALDLELPLDVTFEKSAPRQRWTDKLAQKGQTLGGFVPAEQIRLNANLNRWRTDDPGNRIDRVEVYRNDGSYSTYGVSHLPNLRLPAPHASCEPIRFRPIGDREYDEALATVKDGKVDFGPGGPERTAKIASFNVALALGAGPAWSTRPVATDQDVVPPVYFTGLGQFAAVLRPRKPGWSRSFVELRLIATLGQWGFVEDFGSVQNQQFQNLTWARFLFEPAIGYDVAHRVALTVGGGMGTSWPVNRPDELTSQRFTFIGSPSLDARVRFSKRFSLILQLRGIFGEKEFQQESSSGQENTDDVKKFTAYSLVTLVGLLLSF